MNVDMNSGDSGDATRIGTVFQKLLGTGTCRFGLDCSHLHEPGRAIRDAVANGQISERRYQSYQEMV